MKKILLGLALVIGLNISSAQAQNLTQPVSNGSIVSPITNPIRGVANDLGQAVYDIRSIINVGAQGTNQIRGVIGTGAGIVSDINEIGCIINGDCGVTPEGRFELPSPEKFNTIGENVSLRQFILNVLNFVLSFLGLIAVVALVYAGFLYVTAGGDDSAHEKSKKIVIYAVIGILLILASFAIVNTVIRNAGVGTDDRNDVSNVPAANLPPQGGGNGNGVIVPQGGGSVGSNGAGVNLRNSLSNPIIVSGNGVQDSLNSAFVSLEDARQGIGVSLSTQAFAIIDFGDGFQAVIDTTQNPNLVVTHAYGESGSYNITAILQTADGSQGSFQKRLNVGGLQAKIRGPQTDVLINTPVEFSAQGSNSQQGTIVDYNWSCDSCAITNNGEANVTATFTAAGSHQVNLEISNSLGQAASQSFNVQVVGDTPVAQFTAKSTKDTNRPSEFRFDASESTDIQGSNRGLTYHWDFHGITRQNSSPQTVYTFPNPGSVTVTLYVSQNFNGQILESETVSQTIDVPSTLSVDFDVY